MKTLMPLDKLNDWIDKNQGEDTALQVGKQETAIKYKGIKIGTLTVHVSVQSDGLIYMTCDFAKMDEGFSFEPEVDPIPKT